MLTTVARHDPHTVASLVSIVAELVTKDKKYNAGKDQLDSAHLYLYPYTVTARYRLIVHPCVSFLPYTVRARQKLIVQPNVHGFLPR